MKWYERFAGKRRNFGIENLMAYIVISMVIIFLADSIMGLPIIEWLSLVRSEVLKGQLWRLFTFVLIPQSSSPIFIIFSAAFYYFVGSSLEREWGKASFTLYYLIGMVGAIFAAMLTGYADSMFLNMSLFLAFAFLFPEMEFRIYFLIPVKAKYLGYLDLGILFVYVVIGIFNIISYRNWSTFVSVTASIANFFLFFGSGMVQNIQRTIQNKKRKAKYERDLRKGRDDKNQ